MNTLRNALFLFLLQLVSSLVIAQSAGVLLSGSVLDSLSRGPMAFATVTLLTTDKANVESVITNHTGAFSFKPVSAGAFLVHVSYLGYKTHTQEIVITAGQNTIALTPMLLVPDNISLTEVNVRATRPFIEQQPGKIVVNVAESILSASASALDVLRRAPFVRVDPQGGISLRGKSVVVYIDGKQTNLSGENLESLLTTLAGEGIDQIELITQPSARYDAAGAAMINIRTLKMRSMGFNGTATAGVGTGRRVRSNAGVQLNHKTSRTNMYGNYDYQYNQQYFDNVSERVFTTPAGVGQRIVGTEVDLRRRNLHSFRSGVEYTLTPKTTVGLLLQGNFNSRRRQSNVRTQVSQTGVRPDSVVNTTNLGYAAFNNLNINANLRHVFDSTGRSISVDTDYGRFNNPWTDAITNQYGKEPSSREVLNLPRGQYIAIKSLKISYNQPLWGGAVETGLQLRHTHTDTDFEFQRLSLGQHVTVPALSFQYQYTEAVNSGYVSYSGHLRKIQYQAGLRVEQTHVEGVTAGDDQVYAQRYANVFPSLSLQYNRSEAHQFSLGYSTRIARPDYQSLNAAIIYESPFAYIRGNPVLKPALTQSLEAGYTFKQLLIVSFAYTRTNRAFTTLPLQEGNVTILQNQNYDRAGLWSLDLMYTKQLTSRWMTSTGFQALYSRNTLTNLGLPTNNGAFYYAYTQNSVSLGGSTKLQVTAYYVPSSTASVYCYKPYGALELGIQRPVWHRKLDLKASIGDALNTITYTTEYGGAGLQLTQRNKIETRFLRLTVSHKFGNQHVRIRERKSGLEAETNRINMGK